MKETMAYCSVTYLWSFTRKDLDLPADATDEELEQAAQSKMEKITDYISDMADVFHNDLEVNVA